MDEPARFDILAEITEIAGPAAAIQVAAAKGGTRPYFPLPDNLRPDHWLAEAVGMEAARKIAERLGGGALPVPLGPFSGCLARARQAAIQALAEGKSTAEAARIAGLTQRTIHRLRKPNQDDGQYDLF